MANNCYLIYIPREIIYITISIFVIVYCFKIRNYTDNLKDIKIKVNFTDPEYKKNFNILNTEIEEFFNKYNLKSDQVLSDNEYFKNIFNHFSRISLALIILLIILIVYSICGPCLSAINGIDWGSSEDDNFEPYYNIVLVLLIGSSAILFIFLCLYVGFYIDYKNTFQNEFFELYNTINGENIKKSFENHYQNLFDLNIAILVNIILLSSLIFILLFYIFLYFDPFNWFCKECDNDDD